MFDFVPISSLFSHSVILILFLDLCLTGKRICSPTPDLVTHHSHVFQVKHTER